MVVFIDGEPAKKEYRRFRIKTVEGANDFASLNEVLGRRFTHGLQEKAERKEQGLSPIGGKFSDLPDLVLIDGGPQQLRFARQALLSVPAKMPEPNTPEYTRAVIAAAAPRSRASDTSVRIASSPRGVR